MYFQLASLSTRKGSYSQIPGNSILNVDELLNIDITINLFFPAPVHEGRSQRAAKADVAEEDFPENISAGLQGLLCLACCPRVQE